MGGPESPRAKQAIRVLRSTTMSVEQERVPTDSNSTVVGAFQLGAAVEYFSATQNCWVPAHVVAFHGDGTYDLDVKRSALPENIRWPAAASIGATIAERRPASTTRSWIVKT